MSEAAPAGRRVSRGAFLARSAQRSVRLPVLGLLGVVVGAAAFGSSIGWYTRATQPAHVNVSTGTAYASASQVSVSSQGWYYDVPPDVPWRIQGQTWQTGTRPSCLAPSADVHRLRFGWVKFTDDVTEGRRLVWLECP